MSVYSDSDYACIVTRVWNNSTLKYDVQVTSAHEFKNVALGTFYIVASIIYMIGYIPCLIAISTQPLILNNTFKILATMGVVDILELMSNAFASGILSVWGLPFCDALGYHIKYLGSIGNGGWMAYCCLCMTLAFNRVVVMRSSALSNYWFGGRRVYIWLMLSTLAGCFWLMLFALPGVSFTYHAGIGYWRFTGHDDETNYALILQSLLNVITPIIMAICYGDVLRNLHKKSKVVTRVTQRAYMEKCVTLQAFILCFNTALASLTAVINPHISWNRAIFGQLPNVTANILWQIAHGGNIFVYLFLNKSIRRRVIEILTRHRLSPPPDSYGVKRIGNNGYIITTSSNHVTSNIAKISEI